MAVAFHEPDKISSLFKPHLEDTLEKSAKNLDEWESDEWWREK